MSDDRYAKFDYSRVINWNERLQREWPLLEAVLTSGPSRRILDLGSGTGEHARFLASKGFEVTGVDLSESMMEKSRTTPAENVRFIGGDMREIAALLPGERFGGALCLGNALPHLTQDDDLRRLFAGLRRVLEPGASFITQILNYDRIEAKRERALPLTFHRDPDDAQSTIIFLRTMELLPDGRAIFMPATIRQRSDREPPMELVASRRVEIRAWRRTQIEALLRENGFASVTLFGSYARDPFESSESRDLIVVAKD